MLPNASPSNFANAASPPNTATTPSKPTAACSPNPFKNGWTAFNNYKSSLKTRFPVFRLPHHHPKSSLKNNQERVCRLGSASRLIRLRLLHKTEI